MAKIIEETIVLKLSRIAKDDGKSASIVTEELTATLEALATELLGEHVIVEVLVV